MIDAVRRDYLIAKALAYCVAAMERLPFYQRELSDEKDRQMLFDIIIIPEADREQLRREARKNFRPRLMTSQTQPRNSNGAYAFWRECPTAELLHMSSSNIGESRFLWRGYPAVDVDRLAARPSMNLVSTQQALLPCLAPDHSSLRPRVAPARSFD